MLSRVLVLLISSFCLVASALAQAYQPGLLVRVGGDTLRGEIENGFWTEPPTFIRFRPTPSSPSELFKPRQLRAMSFTNGRYFRYEGLPIDHAAETRMTFINRGLRTNVRIDSVLAEVLVEGPLSLLRVVSPGAIHFLLLAPGRPVLDLSDRKYLREVNGGWELADGNNYRGQLGYYFDKCPAAFSATQTAAFTPEGLASVVQAYNALCSAEQQLGRTWTAPAAASARRPMAVQGGVLAGLRYNRTEAVTYNLNGVCSDCRVRPYGGVYAELFQPGRKLAIYGDFTLSTFRGQGSQFFFSAAPSGTSNFYDYQAWLGTARLGARYFIPLRHDQQLIIGLGYELNRVISPRITALSGPASLVGYEVGYASPTYFPNLGLGWRTGRLTASLDGQMYFHSNPNDNVFTQVSFLEYMGSMFFGKNFALRTGLAYRLGRNPDATNKRP